MEDRRKYGIELIIDLHDCDTNMFDETKLRKYVLEICKMTKMKTHGQPHFWFDDSDLEHLNGTSVLQFIETSNIVVHALNILNAVYINFFSCKEFNTDEVTEYTVSFFKSGKFNSRVLERV